MMVHPAETVRSDEKISVHFRPTTHFEKDTVDDRGRCAMKGTTYNENLGGIV